MIRQTRYFLALFLLSLSACHVSPQSSQIKSTDFSIINGTPVETPDWISQSTVAIYDDYTGEVCSGVLVGDNIVLTAAHCLGPSTESISVLFGLDIVSRVADIRKVINIKMSPYWESRKYQKKNTGDIALLKFEGNMPTGFKPATLLATEQKETLKIGTQVIVAGYGTTAAEKQTVDGILYKTTLQIQDPLFSISEILLDQSQGTSVCHGDSGGPAFVIHNNQVYLWGVTSRGITSGEDLCNQATAFTSAVYYSTWIRRVITELQSSLFDK